MFEAIEWVCDIERVADPVLCERHHQQCSMDTILFFSQKYVHTTLRCTSRQPFDSYNTLNVSCLFVLLMNQYRWGERRGGGRRGEGWGRGEVNSPIAICPRKVEKFFLEQFFHIIFLIIYHLLLYELFIIVCYMQCNLINILYYRNRYCRTTYECNWKYCQKLYKWFQEEPITHCHMSLSVQNFTWIG